MNIHLASHFGMCFGVRDAVRDTQALAEKESITVLGQLVHNPVVSQRLDEAGAALADLQRPGTASTKQVVITAHGASDAIKEKWSSEGFSVVDTTCPLVKKAHRALAKLVLQGYHPVVIGKTDHVEVRGLTGDFPQAQVVLGEADLAVIEDHPKIGIVSQTTQPITYVEQLVELLRQQRPEVDVCFRDTVCQPTKDRQKALDDLCALCDTVVVVGGANSNNTKQLVKRSQALGCTAYHIQTADDLDESWFREAQEVGVTAGTSTLKETVQDVVARLKTWADLPEPALV